MTAWKMETAKARLSEVIRQAQVKGPQRITIRGEAAAVVLSQADFAQLTRAGEGNWVDRFRQAFTGEVDLVRDDDTGRDFSL
ncbi:MAG: type II toxin-antitoxin system prevent-host-death family antitoxin [Caulobacter sp.]